MAYRAVYFFFNGNLDEAQNYLNQALSFGEELHNQNLRTYALTQMGNVFRDKGVFDSAILFYRKALVSNSQKRDDYYEGIVRMNIARYFLAVNKPDSAMAFAQEALKIRTRLGDPFRLADTYILLGNCYFGKENFTEAERLDELGLSMSKGDPTIRNDYLFSIADVKFKRGDFQGALENWRQALAFHRTSHYKYGLATLLFRMGKVFNQQGYYDLATEYLNNALKIAQRAGYRYIEGQIIYELAWVSYRTKNYSDALTYRQTAENIFKLTHAESEIAGSWDLKGLIERRRKNYDTALHYHNKSLVARIKLGNKVDIDAGYFNIGEFYLEMKKFDTALSFYRRSLKMDNELGDTYGKSLNYNRLGNIFTQTNRLDSAKICLDLSMKLAIPTSAQDIFRVNYLDLAKYYEKKRQPQSAIAWYKKYNELGDSIFSKQTAQSLASYRTLYDVERNERQIELLNKDNQLRRAQVQRQQAILYGVVGGSIVLMILAAFYFRFSVKLSRLNKEIAEQKEEIEAQAEELTESNQTISGINEKLEERIEARTAELKQAFKELDTFFYRSSHDFRRPLTTFMGLAEVARVLVKDPTALELFEKVNENALNLDKMLRKLQSVSEVDMQTLIFMEVSLAEIFEVELYELKEAIESKKIRTTISIRLEHPFYSYGALIKIIVQNLLENSIAFSSPEAPHIHLAAYEQGDEVVIEVHDNGRGIEPEYVDRVFEMYLRASELSKGNGLGLYIVKKTVQKLSGRVTLQSEVGQGTTVKVFLPQRREA